MSWRESSLLRPFRVGYRRARAGGYRVIHPFRRYVAQKRMKSLAPVRRVLVLCLGNICRSPYGAARLTDLGEDGVGLEVRSAGLMGDGSPPPETALSAAKKKGLDLEEHSSQVVTLELVAWAELVVVMDLEQSRVLEREFGASGQRVVVLGDLDPGSPDRRGILDPVDQEEEVFLRTYERMDRCLDRLFALIGGAA